MIRCLFCLSMYRQDSKYVYFLGSRPIFPQFIMCFYVKKRQHFPPNSKISHQTSTFPWYRRRFQISTFFFTMCTDIITGVSRRLVWHESLQEWTLGLASKLQPCYHDDVAFNRNPRNHHYLFRIIDLQICT